MVAAPRSRTRARISRCSLFGSYRRRYRRRRQANNGHSSMGITHAACAQYSKVRPLPHQARLSSVRVTGPRREKATSSWDRAITEMVSIWIALSCWSSRNGSR